MGPDDEARELRNRCQALEDAVARLAELLAEPSVTLFGQTAQFGSTYPTTAGSFVYVNLYSISGPELEGTVPATSITTDSLFAICPGPIPAQGSVVTPKQVGAYWVI